MKSKKFILCLTGLIILSAIGFNIYQYQRNKELSDAVVKEESSDTNIDAPVKKARKDIPGPIVKNTYKNDINKLEEYLDATEKELDKTSEKLSEELEKKEAFKNAQAQLQKSISSDPSFRESLKKLKKARLQSIDSDYALLYERLDLSPEELEGFKSIVATWREDDSDNTVPLILSATTDEEKEEARRKRQLDRDKYKEQYIELMGEEKFNIYNDFRMSRFDRGTLERFAQTLPPENRIDNDMMFNLIGRMSEARISIEKKMGFHDIITFPSDNREDSAEREADMAVQVYEKYTEIGDEMLPPEQAEPYNAYIAKEREAYLSQIKMRAF